MKQFNIFVLLVLILSYTSCNKSGNESKLCTVKLDDVEDKTLTYSDIIEVQEWIALDSLNECIIGDVAKIEEFNNEFYILDKTIRKCVLVYDEHGKYLRRIGRIGQGPGEYAEINDFAVNRKAGCVAILSGLSKVYVYSLEGEFRTSKQVSESMLWNITDSDCGYIMSSNNQTYTEGDNAYLLYAFDDDLNFKGKWIRVLSDRMPTLPLLSSALQTVEGEVYYCDVFTNSIYAYNCHADSVAKNYDIHFSAPVPGTVFANVMEFMQKQRDYDFIVEAVVGEDNTLLCYACGGNYNLAVIDANGVVLRNGRYIGRFPKVFRGSDKAYLSPVSADEYLSHWKDLPIKHYNGAISPESNFMILKWTMK